MKDIDKNTTLFNGSSFEKTTALRSGKSESLKPESFKAIFGDLSSFTYHGNLDLSRLNLNSLEGCPQRIVGGTFTIKKNPNLHNLNHFPEKLATSFKLYIGYNLVHCLKKVDINSYKNSIIAISGLLSVKEFVVLTPIQEVYKNIIENLVSFREINGSFEKIQFPGFDHLFDYSEFEKRYNIYKKVDYNQEKFDRALELTQF